MNKKLLALAVAGAFVAPVAMADTSNVVIGGQMHFSLDSIKGKNAGNSDLTNEWNVSSNASNIYFKGTEDLGNGMSAFFQIQSYFSAGGTGNADIGGASSGSTAGVATKDGISSGNTYVGLQSKSWGMVMLGKNDTPVKTLSRKVDLFNNQIGDTRNLVSMASGSVATVATATGTSVTAAVNTSAAAGFDLRPQNVIAYGTPSFNGLGAVIAYVTNVDSGAATDKTVDAWSGNVTYENGPIFAGLGYEKHKLSRTGTTGLNDEKIWRLAAGYNFGDFKVTGLYQRETDINLNAWTGANAAWTAKSDADRTVWGLGGAYKMGSNTLKAQYTHAGDIGDRSSTGASMWSLGVDHAMSKRTTVYAAYAKTNNDDYATYSAMGGGHGDNPGSIGLVCSGGTCTQKSKDPSAFSVGVIHNF